MSKRQERKQSRTAKASRPNRRSENRLASAIIGYEGACKADRKNGAKAYTRPGSQQRW